MFLTADYVYRKLPQQEKEVDTMREDQKERLRKIMGELKKKEASQ